MNLICVRVIIILLFYCLILIFFIIIAWERWCWLNFFACVIKLLNIEGYVPVLSLLFSSFISPDETALSLRGRMIRGHFGGRYFRCPLYSFAKFFKVLYVICTLSLLALILLVTTVFVFIHLAFFAMMAIHTPVSSELSSNLSSVLPLLLMFGVHSSDGPTGIWILHFTLFALLFQRLCALFMVFLPIGVFILIVVFNINRRWILVLLVFFGLPVLTLLLLFVLLTIKGTLSISEARSVIGGWAESVWASKIKVAPLLGTIHSVVYWAL